MPCHRSSWCCCTCGPASQGLSQCLEKRDRRRRQWIESRAVITARPMNDMQRHRACHADGSSCPDHPIKAMAHRKSRELEQHVQLPKSRQGHDETAQQAHQARADPLKAS